MTEKLKAPVIPAKAGIQAIEVAIVFMPTCTKLAMKVSKIFSSCPEQRFHQAQKKCRGRVEG